jgi:transmembrane sensor
MNPRHIHDIDPDAPLTVQAARWWILLNEASATSADHRAFGEWVTRSPERVEAFLKTVRVTKALQSEAVRWPDTPINTLIREAKADQNVIDLHESSNRRGTDAEEATMLPSAADSLRRNGEGRIRGPHRWLREFVGRWPVTKTAGLAAMLLIAAGLWVFAASPQHYSTTIGEQRSVVLADGSIVTLNTSSLIEVELEKNQRTVRLLKGEALFQVAHDEARPFDVIAGAATVRDVGTQFNVERSADSTTITVIEGKVEVGPSEASDRAGSGAPGIGTEIRLSAGEQVAVAFNGRTHAAQADIATVMAWTQRRLIFDHRLLGEIADEFNRYNRQTIQIASPELRNQQVTGTFQANDPASFVDFISKIPGVRIQRDSGVTKIY